MLFDENLSSLNAVPQPGSPLINAANVASGVLTVDQRNLPRPTLGGYDIGAVQYQGVGDGTSDDLIFRDGFQA